MAIQEHIRRSSAQAYDAHSLMCQISRTHRLMLRFDLIKLQ